MPLFNLGLLCIDLDFGLWALDIERWTFRTIFVPFLTLFIAIRIMARHSPKLADVAELADAQVSEAVVTRFKDIAPSCAPKR